MNSWSQALIETMRQRLAKGLVPSGLGSDFATMILQVRVTSSSLPELRSIAAIPGVELRTGNIRLFHCGGHPIFLAQVDSDVRIGCELLEGGIHGGNNVQPSKLSRPRLNSVLFRRVVDVEALAAKHC